MKSTEFIEKIGALAQKDMQKSGILASLTIAQAILESNWGRSGLTTSANNLFGIKGEYKGKFVEMKTKEWTGNEFIEISSKFRKYPSWEESISDHSALFNKLDRYSNLRGCTDYQTACNNVYKDGYATDPSYPTKLIYLIERHNLNKYDVQAAKSESAKSTENKGDDYKMKTIKKGSSGKTVKVWQVIVGVTVDGKFGDKTESATKNYQTSKKLTADGIVGPKTWKVALNSLK